MKNITLGDIENSDYPSNTGRQIGIGNNDRKVKAALCGDSTIDNGA